MGSTGHLIGTDWNWNGNTREYLDRYHTQTNGPVTYRVLASVTKGNTYYAALERVQVGSGQRDVFALVMPYTFYGKGYNRELIVKDMDESVGPYYYDCPAKILDLLTEPVNEDAATWRKKCRENLARAKTRPTVKVGDTILFEKPLTFGGYGRVDTFQVTSWGRRKRFIAVRDNGTNFACRLSRWVFETPYVVIPA